MAAQYDAFGTYLGDYETEEERKKREELANTAVHTQEIKTYGDGTQEKITKEEIPGAIAPKTVSTPAGPVAPDTFARMQQAESGNRDLADTSLVARTFALATATDLTGALTDLAPVSASVGSALTRMR
jgi:hypothetical protein